MDWKDSKNKGSLPWHFTKIKFSKDPDIFHADSDKFKTFKTSGHFNSEKWEERGELFEANKWVLEETSPFSIEKVQKLYYDEGWEISSYLDSTFTSIATPTEIISQKSHNPCGYWWEFAVEGNCYSLTTKLYPTYILECINSLITITEGYFSDNVQHYSNYPIEALTSTLTISSGSFKLMPKYSLGDNLNSTVDVNSGLFKLAKHYTTLNTEILNTTDLQIISGKFKMAVIYYTTWPFESLKSSTVSVTGGYFGS